MRLGPFEIKFARVSRNNLDSWVPKHRTLAGMAHAPNSGARLVLSAEQFASDSCIADHVRRHPGIPIWPSPWEKRLPPQGLSADNADLRAALRSAMCFIHGLCCLGCKAQGRAMASPGKCCRDIDCDAGFYGIDADAIKDLLEAGERLMPGTLAEIEDPPEPINEAGR